MKKIILSFILVTLLYSCTSTKKVMDSWMGSTKQQLIMSWGPPDRTTSDGGSGEILVFSKQGYWPGFNGQGSFTYWDNKYMYVDSEGRIYSYMTRRERIPPLEIDLNIYRKY